MTIDDRHHEMAFDGGSELHDKHLFIVGTVLRDCMIDCAGGEFRLSALGEQRPEQAGVRFV